MLGESASSPQQDTGSAKDAVLSRGRLHHDIRPRTPTLYVAAGETTISAPAAELQPFRQPLRALYHSEKISIRDSFRMVCSSYVCLGMTRDEPMRLCPIRQRSCAREHYPFRVISGSDLDRSPSLPGRHIRMSVLAGISVKSADCTLSRQENEKDVCNLRKLLDFAGFFVKGTAHHVYQKVATSLKIRSLLCISKCHRGEIPDRMGVTWNPRVLLGIGTNGGDAKPFPRRF